MRKPAISISHAVAVVVLAAFAVSGSAAEVAANGPVSYADWRAAYDDVNGDRDVVVRLAPSRFFATERIEAHGLVRLDLIGGTASVELADLDRAVDAWVLDNKPGPGKSILAEDGDVLIHLGQLLPDDDGTARLTVELGADAFRGVAVDWILISALGEHPAASRLLYGSRHVYEARYTRERLDREGFTEPRPAVHTKAATAVTVDAAGRNPFESGPLASRGVGGKAFAPSSKATIYIAITPNPILVSRGHVPQDTFAGGELFFRETFEGNNRSCATCHPAENNQTIDVPFISSLSAGDPLFVAEQRPPSDPISNLERPPLMRNFGLILENVDDLSDPNNRFLMRGVPHSLSMSTSITAPPGNPNVMNHTGWSGDGAPSPGRLREFLLGAVIQHYPKNSLARVSKQEAPAGYPFDFRLPTDLELDLTNEFMLNAGRRNELNLASVSLTEPRADAGRTRFINSGCNGCHVNASANVAGGLNLNFFTGVEQLPNPAQGFAGIYFPLDGGFGGQGVTNPNFDCDGDTVLDCFGDGQFNSVGLIEAADTPPFFHNNTVATIEGAVAFYQAPPFPNPLGFTPQEVDNVGAFLRVINAAFNLQMGRQRTVVALDIDRQADYAPSFSQFAHIRGTANRLILLAAHEVEDAYQVLTEGPLGTLNASSVQRLVNAYDNLRYAFYSTNTSNRIYYLQSAAEHLRVSNLYLGSGMTFDLGEGNLLF